MKKVVAYCRVSTDAQAEKFGIEAQKTIISDYCRKNDMEITDWYIDEGESGVKENRPQLDRLLFGDIQNPPVDSVIVAKSDRVARDIKLYFYYMMLLEKKNIHLVSATEEVVNDNTGLGSVYKALMLFVAEQERNNITKRTSGGRAKKAASGGYSGGRAPYGYDAVDGKLVINEREADAVREIFELREEGLTLKAISSQMNFMGYTTKSGGKFATSTIQTILNNENTYRGMYRYGNGEWVKGEQEAVL